MRKIPPGFDWNRSFSVLWKHNTLQINAFIFSENLHNPEVTSSNLVLATWKSRTYVKSWVLCYFCVRFAWGFAWGFCHLMLTPVFNNILFKLKNLFFHFSFLCRIGNIYKIYYHYMNLICISYLSFFKSIFMFNFEYFLYILTSNKIHLVK